MRAALRGRSEEGNLADESPFTLRWLCNPSVVILLPVLAFEMSILVADSSQGIDRLYPEAGDRPLQGCAGFRDTIARLFSTKYLNNCQ